jgi:DNA-binding transcriptional ArsR family regulator
MANLGSDKTDEVLRGSTLEIYRFFLKSGRPIGVREVQRSLNLSSPSLAMYHISKLEDAGLLKRENGNYVIDRVVLEDTVRIRHFLVPRYLFYAFFTVTALIIELTLLRPQIITSGYFFTTVVIAVCAVAFCFETIKTWMKSRL